MLKNRSCFLVCVQRCIVTISCCTANKATWVCMRSNMATHTSNTEAQWGVIDRKYRCNSPGPLYCAGSLSAHSLFPPPRFLHRLVINDRNKHFKNVLSVKDGKKMHLYNRWLRKLPCSLVQKAPMLESIWIVNTQWSRQCLKYTGWMGLPSDHRGYTVHYLLKLSINFLSHSRSPYVTRSCSLLVWNSLSLSF